MMLLPKKCASASSREQVSARFASLCLLSVIPVLGRLAVVAAALGGAAADSRGYCNEHADFLAGLLVSAFRGSCPQTDRRLSKSRSRLPISQDFIDWHAACLVTVFTKRLRAAVFVTSPSSRSVQPKGIASRFTTSDAGAGGEATAVMG